MTRRSSPFRPPNELADLTEVLGQARAVEALRFGIGIRRPGDNLFVLGAPGTGRNSLVRQYLTRCAAAAAVPPDWCYVNNFGTEVSVSI